ncbi:MAG: hypothetical protein EOO43_03800 [Flavobacterium sp.]|nr:MAG: hypothetical protein EOO43_03800 [Flavobacterium sp.]
MNFYEEIEYLRHKVIDTTIIKSWLTKNESNFFEAIIKSHCKKWIKWSYYDEKPFPCVCQVREEDCIFIELYYELQRVIKLHEKEIYFKKALDEYLVANDDDSAVLAWIISHSEIGTKLFFKTTLSFLLPYKKITIQLDVVECCTIIQFQDLFSLVYYSEKIQKKLNL